MVNQDRKSAGLPPLEHDPALSRIARMKSRDMLDGNYFAHESPTWGTAREMLTRLGYDFAACGENIARHATVQKAQAAFLSSQGHRRNILSANWQRVGVGVALDENGHAYVTQLFAR
ncbi:MAG: transporter [Clostridia bacterium]|nr:transporter [Clostridia bacterium]